MPPRVDHDERRREIIDALCRVTLAKGLSAVSFREVAAEAGVSVRRVQYYFGTKAQLLFATIQLVGERVVMRGLARIADAGPNPSPRALLRGSLLGSLPTDDESRADSLLFLTFYIAALTDPSLASDETLGAPRVSVDAITDILRSAQQAGALRAGVDPEMDAAMILAANTGLILSVSSGLATCDEALAILDHQLDRLFRSRNR